MKRSPAIILLAILLVNSAGFYMYYVIELHRIHISMREKLRLLPDENLTRLRLTSVEFKNSLVEEGELKIDGKMFDIARVHERSDSVIVFCLHDHEEDDLLAFIGGVISRPFTTDRSISNFLSGYFSLSYLPSTGVGIMLPAQSKSIAHCVRYFESHYIKHLSFPLQPPRPHSSKLVA